MPGIVPNKDVLYFEKISVFCPDQGYISPPFMEPGEHGIYRLHRGTIAHQIDMMHRISDIPGKHAHHHIHSMVHMPSKVREAQERGISEVWRIEASIERLPSRCARPAPHRALTPRAPTLYCG